jgi:uncharacterized membrane protein YphA (DoxX/SURF4 family)
MTGGKKSPHSSKTRTFVRVAALLVVVLLAAKWMMVEFGVTDIKWAPQGLPHSLPFPFSVYILYLAIVSLVAVCSFTRVGIGISLISNLLICACYGAWFYLSSSRTSHGISPLNPEGAARRILGLFNATLWDVVALTLIAYILVVQLIILARLFGILKLQTPRESV